MMQVLMSKLTVLINDQRIINFLTLSIPVLMGIFIFIIPFPHNSATQEICFYLSVFLALTLALYKKIDFSFKAPLTVPLILFLIWTVMSLTTALNKGNTFHDIYAHLTKHIVLFYLVVNFFNDRKRFVILTWVLILSASLFSIGGIIYFYIISGNNWGTRLGLPEVGIGVNYLGFFTITAILFSLTHFAKEDNLPRKIASIFCVLASSIATILTATKGTFLGLIFPLFLLLPRHKKTITTFALFFLIFALFFLVIVSITPVKQILNPESIEQRKKILYIYSEIIKDYPIAGIGYGMQTYQKNIIDEYNLKVPPECKINTFHAPHNTFIDVTVRLGVVGLALFLYILFIYGRMGWRLVRHGRNDFIKTWALCLTAALVSFLIQGMIADLLLGVQIIIFFILMAMMTILWRLNQEQNDLISIAS